MKHILFATFLLTQSCTQEVVDDSAAGWFLDDPKMTRNYSVPTETRSGRRIYLPEQIEVDGDALLVRNSGTMILNSTRYDMILLDGVLDIFNNVNPVNVGREDCWLSYEITSADHGSEVKIELSNDKVSVRALRDGKTEIIVHGRRNESVSQNCGNGYPTNLEYRLDLTIVTPDSAPFTVVGDCGSTPRVSENSLVQISATPVKNGEVLENLINWSGYPNFKVTQDTGFIKDDVDGLTIRNIKRGTLRLETEYGDITDILVTPVSDLQDFELIPYTRNRISYPLDSNVIRGGWLPLAIVNPSFARQHCNDAAAPILTSLTPEICIIKKESPYFFNLDTYERKLMSIPSYIDFETGQK